MPKQQVDDGVSLYYEDVGQGPPVVFVHGFGMSHAVWESQVQALSDAFRCITLDLRGHGASDKPGDGYDITRNARDIAEFIEGLELERPAYVGWSLGVAIAFQLVGDFGNICSKMVLVFPAPGLPRMRRDRTVSVSWAHSLSSMRSLSHWGGRARRAPRMSSPLNGLT